MATPRSQRIGIWIIAIVLTVGTLGSFLIMGLSIGNQKIDQAQQEKLDNEMQALATDYQSKVNAQTQELSDKYYGEFSQYASLPAVFNAEDVTVLNTNNLKVGDGGEVTSSSEYSAYYIGWNPSGVIFDQSISSGALKAPLEGGDTITGWSEGIIGMKFGGVREIDIPYDKAYGATGSGENIPANTPIKFVVMIIPKVTEVPIPDALMKYYQSANS